MVEMICIVCPIGCHLQVDEKNNYAVTGNTCPRGITYGKDELVAPKRVVTSTVKIKNGLYNRIPVKTNGSIPKELVKKTMEIISKVELSSPIKVGEVVLKNIFDTGVDIVTTRSM